VKFGCVISRYSVLYSYFSVSKFGCVNREIWFEIWLREICCVISRYSSSWNSGFWRQHLKI